MAKRDMNRARNDCLTQCVAYYFKVHPHTVPFFIKHKNWRERLHRYFRRRDLVLEWWIYNPRLLANKKKLYFVQGVCPGSKAKKKWDSRAVNHMTIFKGKKLHFDPEYKKRALKARLWVLLLTPVAKKKSVTIRS